MGLTMIILAITCRALGRTEVEGCIPGGLTFAVTTIYFFAIGILAAI